VVKSKGRGVNIVEKAVDTRLCQFLC
jgi:hypothetical protein